MEGRTATTRPPVTRWIRHQGEPARVAHPMLTRDKKPTTIASVLGPETVRRTQRALSDPRPDRCFEALDALGWNDGDASVVWRPVSRSIGQCHLGSYPTGASVARSRASEGAAPDGDQSWWKIPYYGDYRWSLEFDRGCIRYCDLLAREECVIAQGDLSVEVLRGLTPTHFAEQGSLSPIGVKRQALPGRPGQRAADELSEKMSSWFQAYLSLGTRRSATAGEQEKFTKILSAIILLRTIEDVGHLEWLQKGTLLGAARSTGGARNLLKRAGTDLNSRILHGVADLLPAADRFRNLIESFYGEDLDFATLDVDPVGQFYQTVLGVQYDIRPKRQTSLLKENMDVVEDRSLRKKRGAYFTPREYSDLLARKLLLPLVRNARTESELPVVLDIAAGSGQLLSAAMRQIFSVSRWRSPETVIHVLDNCLWAVDDDPNAPQLAALNALRVAVQRVPEVLSSGLKFPSLNKNFIRGNSLNQKTLSEIPDADVVLLNPPFLGARDWRAPQGAVDAVKQMERHAHSAFAFCRAGLEKLRPGGEMGLLLPAQPIQGLQNRAARESIWEHLRIETVLINQTAEAFGQDEQSYTSAVLGHKSYDGEGERARTQVISVAGERGADLCALAAGAWRDPAKSALITPSAERPWDWTGEGGITIDAGKHSVPLVRVSELLGAELHQPVSCAPEPWGRDLFLFQMVAPGVFRHQKTGKEVRGTSPLLRPVVVPNYMMTLPPLLEPKSGRSNDLRVFFPADGSPSGVRMQSLRKADPTGYEIAQMIRDCVLATKTKDILGPSGHAFRQMVEAGVIRISWSRTYSSEPRPILFLTQSANEPGHELVWPAWIDSSGTFVPLGGNWARFSDRRAAIAVAVLLNVRVAVDTLLRQATSSTLRKDRTRQPSLSMQNAWQVPDVRDPRSKVLVDEIERAFGAYKEHCASLERAEALQQPEWKRLLDLGEDLWKL